MEETYEKAGLFYLGKDVDRDSFNPTDVLTLLKNKNFTTHAAIIGMTGSGKTGLGIDIIEEAAIDNIPAIVIDPKGDMGNLCLTDPTFSPDGFLPWVEDEAKSKGEDPVKYANKVASSWKEGLESSDQSLERVGRFHSVKKTIYTPGSESGIAINLMSSLDIPDKKIFKNSDNLTSYLKSSVMGLLSLVGIDADPIDSKEYILLSQIILKSWTEGRGLSIEELVGRIVNPPFKKIGVLPLDNFYPSKERFKLATKFNAVIASPSFANWLNGDALDIKSLLYDEDGRAKISIFSIAHLNDDERMFFVTLLLNKYIAWMRLQSGSSRLKTLLYMDEIHGFFPPVKNPPSKEPMITLLKQARAFGVGIILSTQNPVDLDYKGLSNIGTWCIGRLQTTQDIDRVIDGLGGKIDSKFDKKEISALLSNLKKRTFFLKSAHLEDIRLFGTRWAMSYLKGPLKRDDISSLMKNQKSVDDTEALATRSHSEDGYKRVNMLDNSINQYYEIDMTGANKYHPSIVAKTQIYYFDQRRGIDLTKSSSVLLDIDGVVSIDWDDAEVDDIDFTRLPEEEPKNALYVPVAREISTDSQLKQASKSLREHLYQNGGLELYRCKELRSESKPEESLKEFKIQAQEKLDDKKDEALEKIKERYGRKEQRLKDQISRAKERAEKEKGDQLSSMLNVGASILGALFGRTTTSKIGTVVNRGTKAFKERGDVSRAEAKILELEDKMADLGDELDTKIDEIVGKYGIENYTIETFSIKPKKRDISVTDIAILWRT